MTVIVDAEYVTRAMEEAIATLLRDCPDTDFIVIAVQAPDTFDPKLVEKNGVVALPVIIRSTVPPELAVIAMRSISVHIERSSPPAMGSKRSKG